MTNEGASAMQIVCPECGSTEVTWELVECERLLLCEDCTSRLAESARLCEDEPAGVTFGWDDEVCFELRTADWVAFYGPITLEGILDEASRVSAEESAHVGACCGLRVEVVVLYGPPELDHEAHVAWVSAECGQSHRVVNSPHWLMRTSSNELDGWTIKGAVPA